MSGFDDFAQLAPEGHYVALRVRFTSPFHEENRLPEAWITEYTADGLMVFDPIMQWVFSQTGAIRWSELSARDYRGVLVRATRHKMNFGVAASTQDAVTGERSFGIFAREDREFSNDEIAELMATLVKLHRTKRRPQGLTDAECEALTLIRNGERLKSIAHKLGITESAVKARLVSAKRKLGARTSVHAVSLAAEAGLI
ncbi:MAG: autoinducer binding domain-containing protein [Rhodobacteraceae bacterium]|nr:autoinducer binding domain-containing protein [Paracoccaceae bacterium]